MGDVITRANGRPVRSSSDIHNLVGLMRINQVVELEIIRGGQRGVIKATIEKMQVVTVDGNEFSFRMAGSKIGEIKENDLKDGYVEFLQVMEVTPNSPAWNIGLREDDRIVSINKQRVKTFEEAYAAAQSSRVLLLNIQRGDQALFVLLK